MIKEHIALVVLLITSCIIAQDQPPVGIYNAGNTCFMNSALQCLYHSNELTKALEKLPVGYYKDNSAGQAYLNFLKIYKQHAASKTKVEREIAKINWCVQLIKLIPLTEEEKRRGHTVKQVGGTEDASELTNNLFQHLFVDDVKPSFFQTLPKYGYPLNQLLHNELTDSIVTIIRQSKQLIDKSTKDPVGNPSIVSSEQYVLPVSIVKDLREDTLPTKDSVKIFGSLEDALKNMFNKQQFSPAEAINPFYKIQAILKLPEILILSLDRFTYLADSADERNKIYNLIPFPMNGLSLKSYLSEPDSQESNYDLFGIVRHHFEGAHYTAFVKVNNQWYLCDDKDVTPVPESDVNDIAKEQGTSDKIEIRSDLDNMPERKVSRYLTPYMLFYKQRAGKKFNVEKKNIITTKDLEQILLKTIPATYLSLPYLSMFQAAYKVTLDSLAQGINEGLVNLDYIKDIFQSWAEDREKKERPNILKNVSVVLSALSNRFKDLNKSQ